MATMEAESLLKEDLCFTGHRIDALWENTVECFIQRFIFMVLHTVILVNEGDPNEKQKRRVLKKRHSLIPKISIIIAKP